MEQKYSRGKHGRASSGGISYGSFSTDLRGTSISQIKPWITTEQEVSGTESFLLKNSSLQQSSRKSEEQKELKVFC